MASAGKVTAIILLIALIVGAGLGLWWYVAKQGYFKSPADLREELAESERIRELLAEENTELQDEVDDLSGRGVSPAALIGLVFGGLVLAFFALQSESAIGRMITMQEAQDYCVKYLEREHNIKDARKKSVLVGARAFLQVVPQSGFVVDGDPDGLWYGFEFAKSRFVGSGHVPAELCVCSVLIKANDHLRQMSLFFDQNLDAVADSKKFKVQRSPDTQDLTKVLSGLDRGAELQRSLDVLSGGDRNG